MTCYYNQTFNVYVYVEQYSYKNWIKVNEQHKQLNGGDLRLTQHEFKGLTFYTFGLLYPEIERRPGHKGEWSSNQTTIEREFGIKLLGIGLDGMAVSMTYEQLFKIFNPNVYQIDNRDHATGLSSSIIIDPEYQQWYDADGNPIPINFR